METCKTKESKNDYLKILEKDFDLIEEIFSEELIVKYFKRNYGIMFPKAKHLGIKNFQCSRYARKIANLEGFFLNPANAWELADKNYSEDYNLSNLKKDCLILFYHPRSLFNKKGRVGTHIGYCLGKDPNGESYFIQQLKINTKILSETQMKEKGFVGKRIIFPERF